MFEIDEIERRLRCAKCRLRKARIIPTEPPEGHARETGRPKWQQAFKRGEVSPDEAG